METLTDYEVETYFKGKKLEQSTSNLVVSAYCVAALVAAIVILTICAIIGGI